MPHPRVLIQGLADPEAGSVFLSRLNRPFTGAWYKALTAAAW
jgi:hypothetical protein